MLSDKAIVGTIRIFDTSHRVLNAVGFGKNWDYIRIIVGGKQRQNILALESVTTTNSIPANCRRSNNRE